MFDFLIVIGSIVDVVLSEVDVSSAPTSGAPAREYAVPRFVGVNRGAEMLGWQSDVGVSG